MEKNALKEKLLKACISKHQSVIDDFNARLHELNQSMQNINDEEIDGGQNAQKMRMDAEALALINQLQFANTEMGLLQKMNFENESRADQAKLGAVVATDKETFFVSSSIEQFNVNGKTYLGLSIHSPLFKAMAGKRKGDEFSYNNVAYTITEIF